MNLDSCYIACICEGSSENAIINLLLDSDKLIFNYEQLLNQEIIRTRSAKEFERKYLRKSFDKDITVLRILDSRKENFKLSKAYKNKISVINIITAPEIEMLIIFNEGQFTQFKKSKMKPSDFCKVKLQYKYVKRYDFVIEYFSDIDELINSISQYKKNSKIRRDELTLFDLIKK